MNTTFWMETRMNYIKIYRNLINKDYSNADYTEKHHVIPRSIGGGNERGNIKVLSGKAHMIAHHLLMKMFPESRELKGAYAQMCVKNLGKSFVSPRQYHEGKRILSESMKDKNHPCQIDVAHEKGAETLKRMYKDGTFTGRKGAVLTDEQKKNISEGRKGKGLGKSYIRSDETRRKLSESRTGVKTGPRSEEVKRKISESKKGISRSDETKKKLSELKRNQTLTCPHCNKVMKASPGAYRHIKTWCKSINEIS